MNFGQLISWVGVLLNVGAAVGYCIARDYKRALYFFFAACITLTVIWR